MRPSLFHILWMPCGSVSFQFHPSRTAALFFFTHRRKPIPSLLIVSFTPFLSLAWLCHSPIHQLLHEHQGMDFNADKGKPSPTRSNPFFDLIKLIHFFFPALAREFLLSFWFRVHRDKANHKTRVIQIELKVWMKVIFLSSSSFNVDLLPYCIFTFLITIIVFVCVSV